MHKFKKTKLVFISLIAIAGSVSSCKKQSGSDRLTIPEPTIAVEKIQATVVDNIDITLRDNYRILLRGIEYNYSLSKALLVASPVRAPYQLPYKKDTGGNLQPISEQQALIIQLVASGYLFQNNELKDPPPPRPIIKDQETEKNLINADMLIGKFFGVPSNNLANINFTHANNLLDFEIKNIVSDKIESIKLVIRNEQFKPLRLTNNRYRAVITGSWYTPADVTVLIYNVDKSFIAKKIINAQDVKQDRHYNLMLEANQDNTNYTVINKSETKWSDEKWPQ